MKFIGRKYEFKLLKEHLANKTNGSLIAIYGRRRIGKTRLIFEFFKNHNIIAFEGLEGGSTQEQKEHFLSTLAKISKDPSFSLHAKSSWSEILIKLSEWLGKKKAIVFFDEFQWIAANRTELVSHLKYVWDNYFTKKNNIHLIVCGSISSFIYKKVLRSKALYGRIDLEINLKPLPANDFIQEYKNKRSILELLEFYLFAGGVPQYLNLYKRSKSVQLNIQSLICSKDSYLVKEFERIFIGHFSKNKHYRSILNFLAKNKYATKDQVERKISITSGGRTTSYLENLELSGFIEEIIPIGSSIDTKLARYRVADNYLQFYFRFIKPKLKLLRQSKEALPLNKLMSEQQYAIWRGLAFERFCSGHHDLISSALGFSAVRYEYGSYYKRADLKTGTQVDLLFKRADDVITLCEVKWQKNLSAKKLIEQIEKKKERLEDLKYHHIEPVLITALPVSKDFNKEGYFSRVLTPEDLFL